VSAADSAPGPYRPPAWLPGGHAQTIWPTFVARPEIAFRRERVDTPDGDFWDLDWLDPPATPPAGAPAPTVILFHGLEGGSDSHYARALMALLRDRGWRGVIPHFRGCGGELNRLPRAYHSGDHEEIGAMLAAVHARVDDRRSGAPLYAVGVSLGGSALLNWLGRAGAAAAAMLGAAAAVSTPLDLTAAGHAIGRGFNRLYTWHFLWTLVPKSVALAQRHPGLLDPSRVRRVRNLYDFDELVTAPLHGFAGTDDYWSRASSKPWLARIRVPTLVLNARNDPFVPAASLPAPGDVGAHVQLEQPNGGGHVGFLTGPFPGNVRWLPQRLIQFFVAGR
jgi:predicted alpha/beta-fold hydrolase